MKLKGIKYLCGCDWEGEAGPYCCAHHDSIDPESIATALSSIRDNWPSRDKLGRIARETYRQHMFGGHGGLTYDQMSEGDREMERKIADAIVEVILESMDAPQQE